MSTDRYIYRETRYLEGLLPLPGTAALPPKPIAERLDRSCGSKAGGGDMAEIESLPLELLALCLSKLPAADVISRLRVGHVSHKWRDAQKLPLVWESVHVPISTLQVLREYRLARSLYMMQGSLVRVAVFGIATPKEPNRPYWEAPSHLVAQARLDTLLSQFRQLQELELNWLPPFELAFLGPSLPCLRRLALKLVKGQAGRENPHRSVKSLRLFTGLRHLAVQSDWLWDVAIGQSLLDGLGALHKLTYLLLHLNCTQRLSLPESVSRLTKLEVLSMRPNIKLHDSCSSLSALSSLQSEWVAREGVRGISLLPALRTLSLVVRGAPDPPWGGKELFELQRAARQVTNLLLWNCRCVKKSGGVGCVSSSLPVLVELSVKLRGDLIDSLVWSKDCRLQKLRCESITGGEVSRVFTALKALTSLTCLVVDQWKTQTMALSTLPVGPYLASLRVLTLKNVGLCCVPPQLSECRALHTLDISHNYKLCLGPACAQTLVALPSLWSLYLCQEGCAPWPQDSFVAIRCIYYFFSRAWKAGSLKCHTGHGLEGYRQV